MVGHDIRNPLQAVLSDTYLLKEELSAMPECKNKEGVAESIDSIEKNIAYINKIVQDLQDYSRAITPEIAETNLSKVFLDVFKIVDVPDSIKLSISVKDSEKIKTDPMLLQRAFTNIVTNAIQAMPGGGNLEINGRCEGNRVFVSISDTGVGIPEEVKPKLFTPMITTKAKGQGFGLAVAKRLIEALKGTITFESEKEKGTKFIIELPSDCF
jgi:signal transduction histidine kinase